MLALPFPSPVVRRVADVLRVVADTVACVVLGFCLSSATLPASTCSTCDAHQATHVAARGDQ